MQPSASQYYRSPPCEFSTRPFGIQLSSNLRHHNEYNKTSCCALPSDLPAAAWVAARSHLCYASGFLIFLVQAGAINALPQIFYKSMVIGVIELENLSPIQCSFGFAHLNV
mmetsp:Transcript_21328/g.32558  ORF Transcript_21328/g.32558 Transcript_21328/m.32558 type:complete len:111 (+) Transcript_21328:175-507(+)